MSSVCARASARSKSLEFSNAKVLPSVMNGFTSTFWRTKSEEERCTVICAGSASANDDMANPTDEVKSRGVSA